MKPWNKINWPVVQARRALKLKIEDDFWRGWQEQGALQEKGALEHLAQADRATTHALMVWSDDGGMGAINPGEAFLLTEVFYDPEPIETDAKFGETIPPDLRVFEVAAAEPERGEENSGTE